VDRHPGRGNTNRGRTTVLEGLPWVVVVVLVAWSVLLGRTRFGRYVYAIGGNAEAARRAGVNLSRVRVLAFTLCGLTADDGAARALLDAVGSDLRELASACDQLAADTEGPNVTESAAVNMWTAAVLLAAVTVDTLARRRRPDV
jgi:ABC-type xylose transport system permease subunit